MKFHKNYFPFNKKNENNYIINIQINMNSNSIKKKENFEKKINF